MSNNLFMPYYRQSGLKYAGEMARKTGTADAQINLARGVVITNAKGEPMDEETAKAAAEFFGPDGRHNEDYLFFYNNIKTSRFYCICF